MTIYDLPWKWCKVMSFSPDDAGVDIALDISEWGQEKKRKEERKMKESSWQKVRKRELNREERKTENYPSFKKFTC